MLFINKITAAVLQLEIVHCVETTSLKPDRGVGLRPGEWRFFRQEMISMSVEARPPSAF